MFCKICGLLTLTQATAMMKLDARVCQRDATSLSIHSSLMYLSAICHRYLDNNPPFWFSYLLEKGFFHFSKAEISKAQLFLILNVSTYYNAIRQ